MIEYLHPDNPQKRILDQIANGIRSGRIYVLPTDTVYAFACGLDQKSAIEQIYRIKEIPRNKPLSLYCRDFSQASEYVRLENNSLFRWMKITLPGPYTLVLEASRKLPSYTLTRQQTVGIRIVNHPVVSALLERLEVPIIGSSVATGNYGLSSEEIDDLYGHQVTAVVDCGGVSGALSTVLDARVWPMELIREGAGKVQF